MPTTQSDYQKVEEARKKQASFNKEATMLQADASSFADNVMAKIREDRASRGMDAFTKSIGTTTSQLATEPANIRARTADVNPLDVDKITAQQTGQTLETLATQARIGEQREGAIQDPINAYTNQLVTKAQIKKAEADQAAQEADMALEQIRLKMEQDRFELDKMLSQQKLGGQTSPTDVLAMLMGGGQGQAPQYSPKNGEGTISDDGQFVFRGGQWQPTGTGGQKLTREQIALAMQADPKNAAYYQKLYEFMNPEQDDASQTALTLLEQLNTQLQSIPTGRVAGTATRLQSLFGQGPYRQIQQTQSALVPLVARQALKLGVLSDQDVQLTLKTLGSVDNTPEENATAYATIKRLFGGDISPNQSNQNQGYDFVGWEGY